MLFLCYSCGVVGDALSWEVSDIFHNPFFSLGLWMTNFPLRLVLKYCALNKAVHP